MKDLTTKEIIKGLISGIEGIIEGSKLFLRQLEESKNISPDEFDKQIYKLDKIERRIKDLKKEGK